jgi:hypothetical protein
MSLTYQQIWERYSRVEFKRRLYVKFLNENGTYESAFTEISQGLMMKGAVNRLSISLPNSSYNFGRVQVGNATLKILSAFQEFASENVPGSIFRGRVRHRSIIKIEDALIDKYTDPDNPEEIAVTTFQGLIDSTTATTEQGYETVTVLDFMTVLDEINVNELTLTETTLNALVYEVMNRAQFTKFFNVSNSTDYIDAGYDIQAIDTTQYDGTVLEMLEDLAKGHSAFYIDPDDNYFYFKEVLPTDAVQFEFLEENNRKIEISKYREGIDRQITHLYWEDTALSATKSPEPINPRSESFQMDGVTNNAERQRIIDFVLSKTQHAKPYLQVQLPFFPIIKILDRVTLQSFGQAPSDAVRWGMFEWTTQDTTNPNEAPRWRKPAGIKISANDRWMVRSVKHDNRLRTTIECEKIL